MDTRADKRLQGKRPAVSTQKTASPSSPASEPARDWSKALAHWRNIRETKKDDVSDCSANLSTLNALKKDILKAPDFSGKTDMIATLDDSRLWAINRLTSAQEEYRQAIRAVKAFKAHTVSPKPLMRQTLSMMDAVLLLHTEDPEMKVGELREKMMKSAILVDPRKLAGKSTRSVDGPILRVANGHSVRQSTNTKDDTRTLKDVNNKSKKTAPHGKSHPFEPFSQDASKPLIKRKPAPDSLAASKTGKTSGSGSQVEKRHHEDDEPSADESITQRKAPVAKRSSGQAFEETVDEPRKRWSTGSVEKALQITTDKTLTVVEPTVKETYSIKKESAVETKSVDTTKSIDTPSMEPPKAKLERLNNSDSAEVTMLDASMEALSKKSVKLDVYLARKKAKKADTTPEVYHSTSAIEPTTGSSDEEQATVEGHQDVPSVTIKQETPPEADVDVTSAPKDSNEDVTKDETKKSNQKPASNGSSSQTGRPAVHRLVSRKGARKPGEAGVAVVMKKDKKQASRLKAEGDPFIVDDDDEPLEVDIDADARKALESQGLAADAILPGKRRTGGGGSRSQIDWGRKSVAGSSDLKKQKRKRVKDDNESAPAMKKVNRKVAVPRMRHAAPTTDAHDKIIGSVLTVPASSLPVPSADVDAMDIDSVTTLAPEPLAPAASTTNKP